VVSAGTQATISATRRTQSLTAGRYRLEAAVLPASGPPGIATSRTFTVVR
jgi:hypothetical protein